MFMSLLAIAIVLGIGYIWVLRGFFSALLHLACVLAAGAVAFAAWEPLAMLILQKAPATGFFYFIGDAAWGLGLALPFAVSLAILRVATDKLVPGNIIVDDAVNYVGGGICGAATGVITAGIFVISVGFLRVDAKFMGYQPVTAANQGNFEITQNLWLPVDRLTSGLYNHLSSNTLYTSTPLVRYYPDLATAAGAQRMSDGGGKNKNTIRPDGFDIDMHFTVGKNANLPPEQVFADFLNPAVQQVVRLDGSPIGAGAYIDGYLIKFNSGAREKFGQVVVGKGQIRLVTESASGDRETLFPIAVSAQAKSGDDTFGRFRYDGEFYVASVGGASEAPMAFEFAVPQGHEPVALYVRNLRHDVSGEPDRAFPDAAARDAAIQTGSLLAGNRAATLNLAHATTIATTSGRSIAGVSVNNRLENRVVLQKGSTRGIEIDESNLIVNGQQAYAKSEVRSRGVDQALRVDKFFTTRDTNIVQVLVTGDPAQQPTSIFAQAAAPDISQSAPPVLVDTNGQAYEAVGYVYEDRDKYELRYTPGTPLRGLSDMTTGLVRSRDDQTAFLVFRPSVGIEIQHFAIGDTVLTTFDPPLTIDPPRRR